MGRRPKSDPKAADYRAIRAIDGDHPLKAAPFSHVPYQVRRRPNGKVLFFNFRLAREMGLIPKSHPDRLTTELKKALIDTFAIQIINEYDIINDVKVTSSTIKEKPYMATRYLQLQHPDKRGLWSGDGRSIWNGYHKSQDGSHWDITSCGTGATCLSPAANIQNKFFQTGDPDVSYGCGYAMRDEGICQAVFSEILNATGVKTERTLAVIEFEKGLAVNVRAGKNLLRPSHFFNHLKQGHRDRCQAVVDQLIDRQIQNGEWPAVPVGKHKYRHLVDQFSLTFAEMAARFESEYIFCWLDWDGDNVLANGSLIDYGSIRQFGLFHKDYRYDDIQRFSTSIVEQKAKARYTVQVMAQVEEFLRSGEKRPIQEFKDHPALQAFDEEFERCLHRDTLVRLGLTEDQAKYLLRHQAELVQDFLREFFYFERLTSVAGIREVADGITSDAVFCMRDILRELPRKILKDDELFTADDFQSIGHSKYAIKDDLKLTPSRTKHVKRFQELYRELQACVAKRDQRDFTVHMAKVNERAAVKNRYERVTGDAIITIAERLLKQSPRLNTTEFHRLVYDFIDGQILNPDRVKDPYAALEQAAAIHRRRLQSYMRMVGQFSEGI